MFDRLYRIVTSLRLTVILLGLGLVLVFWGTLAQVDLGLYRAQNEFFRSFLVFEKAPGLSVHLPFPGGYTIGWLLLINLFAAHFRYYQPGKRKYGIAMIHLGVVLLLLGQLLTDLLSSESMMHLRNGETKNYSEASSHFELAVVDTTEAATEKAVAIPASRLLKDGDISTPDMPFTIRVKAFHANTSISEKQVEGFSQVKTTAGFGSDIWWRADPHVTEMDKRDMPSGIVELLTPAGSLGTFLISAYLTRPQELTHNGRQYQLTLRPQRFYKPFSVSLLEFKHDKYPGTEIPKNFSSRVRLLHPDKSVDREVLIYMNNPLRFNGETYYQASFDTDNQGTILQVVRNPSWLTPYFSCVLVGAGLIVQFLQHLIGFAAKQKAL